MTIDSDSLNSLDKQNKNDKVLELRSDEIERVPRYSVKENSDNNSTMEVISDNIHVLAESTGINQIEQNDLTRSSAFCVNEANVSSQNDINIGNVAVVNSKEVTFGNKIYYEGPVLIKQYLCDPDQVSVNGAVNPAFEDEYGETINKYSEYNDIESKQTKQTEHSYFKTVITYVKENKKKASALFICVILIILSVIFALDTLFNKRNNIIDISPLYPINMVTRKEWLAQPPKEELTKLELPSNRVIIAHSASEACFNKMDCILFTQRIQRLHMEGRNWSDIAYNFLVGGDGNVYEGRGWDDMGAHTRGYNTKSICIAFIGTFNNVEPPQRQLYAAKNITKLGVEMKKLSQDYQLYGHRQLAPFLSPGAALYNIIKTWDHWINKPEIIS